MKRYIGVLTNWFRTRESLIVSIVCALLMIWLDYSKARSVLAITTAVCMLIFALVAMVCHIYNIRKYGVNFMIKHK